MVWKLIAIVFIFNFCATQSWSANVTVVPNNATLMTSNPTSTPIIRAGFNSPNDGGAAFYNYSSLGCPVPDNGYQVSSSVSGGCWVADFTITKPTPKVWGCQGDGVTDDTACLQAAIDASASSTLWNGPYLYCIKSTVFVKPNHPLIYVGSGTNIDSGGQKGIAQCQPDINLLSIQANSTVIKDLAIIADKTSVNSDGTTVDIDKSTNHVLIENVVIRGSCVGIDAAGNSNSIERVQVYAVGSASANCYGIRIGHATVHAATADLRITNSSFNSDGSNLLAAGVRVEDSGGLYMSNVDVVLGLIGTHFCPGANQEIDWAFITNTVFGDTTKGPALLVDSCHASGIMKGATMNSTWAASSQTQSGIIIKNSNNAVMSGLHFVGLRSFFNYASAVELIGPVFYDVTFDASHFCGNGQAGEGTFPAINVYEGVVAFAIRSSHIAPSCDGLTGPANTRINLAGLNDNVVITGNDLTGIGNIFSGSPTDGASQIVIANNTGADGIVNTIASSSTIAIGFYPIYAVSGSNNIQTILGHPSNRTVILFPRDSALTFVGGAGICRTVSAAQYQRIVLTWIAGLGCWSL